MNDFPHLDEMNVLYVGVKLTDKGEHLHGFYPFVSSTWVLADQREIRRVRIRERTEDDPPSEYFAWEKTDEGGRLCLVQRSEVVFGIQFAYGLEAAEKAGDGRRVNIHIEVLERFPPTV